MKDKSSYIKIHTDSTLLYLFLYAFVSSQLFPSHQVVFIFKKNENNQRLSSSLAQINLGEE